MIRHNKLLAAVVAIATLLVLLVTFELGVMLGYREAAFSYHLNDGFNRNFGAGGAGFGADATHPHPHGSMGQIVSLALPVITVESPDRPEQQVRIGSSTIVRDQERTIRADELTVGEQVVVLGTPNDQGEVEAALVRVVPAPAGTNHP